MILWTEEPGGLGSSVHGILQSRILDWVAISFSRVSSQARDQTWVSHVAGILYHLSHQGSPERKSRQSKSRGRALTPRRQSELGSQLRSPCQPTAYYPPLGRKGIHQVSETDFGEGRPLTEGAAESHSGNRKCHSIDSRHSAVGSQCGTCLGTAGERRLSTCPHTSVLGSSENLPVQGKEGSQQICLRSGPEQREANWTQASRDWAQHPGRLP